MVSGRGPTKMKPLRSTRSAKSAFSGEEPITGVDGHRVGHLRRADDGGDLQVAVPRGRRAYADGLVGEEDVLEVVVRGGVHGDGLDAEFAAGAQDAQAISPRLAISSFSIMGRGRSWVMAGPGAVDCAPGRTPARRIRR